MFGKFISEQKFVVALLEAFELALSSNWLEQKRQSPRHLQPG